MTEDPELQKLLGVFAVSVTMSLALWRWFWLLVRANHGAVVVVGAAGESLLDAGDLQVDLGI